MPPFVDDYLFEVMLEESDWNLDKALKLHEQGEDYFQHHYPNQYAEHIKLSEMNYNYARKQKQN